MSTELCIKLNKNEKNIKKHKKTPSLAKCFDFIYSIAFLYTLDMYRILLNGGY